MEHRTVLFALEPGLFAEHVANLLVELEGDCRFLRLDIGSLTTLESSELGDSALVVLDVDRLVGDVEKSLSSISTCSPDVRVAGFGSGVERGRVDRLMEVGLSGYIPKELGSAETRVALAAILGGGSYRPDAEPRSRHMSGLPSTRKRSREEFGLTEAETDVLALLARGKSNREIALARGTKPNTVRIQLTPIFRKLGVQTRGQAIVVALRHGLTEGTMTTAPADAPLDLAWLLPHMKHRRHPRGHVVFRSGDIGKEMFLIQRGRVAISDIPVELKEHDVFGEIGVFARDHRRTHSATCMTDVDLWALPEDKARHLCVTDPAFALRMLDLVASRRSTDQLRAA